MPATPRLWRGPLPRLGRLRRPFIVGIGLTVAVLAGIGVAVGVSYVRDVEVATTTHSPPLPTASPVATASPTPDSTGEPSPRPSPAAVVTVEPSATADPSPAADPAVGELVYRLTPYVEFFSLVTTSLVADGRLVTMRAGQLEDGALWLEERRLTERGIALVRDEIQATGLFTESGAYVAIPLPGHELPGRGGSGYTMEAGIPHGDVRVAWSSVDSDEPDWAEPSPERERLGVLAERLITLDDWLPREAWADPAPRPYLPTRYRLITIAQTWGGEMSDLPPDVSGVIWPLGGSLLTYGEPLPGSVPEYLQRCAVITADEAQRVVDALAVAGAPLVTPLGERFVTGADLGDRATVRAVDVVLVALHPYQTDCDDAGVPYAW
jgi:hypothetical protein